jgi:putative redox protein
MELTLEAGGHQLAAYVAHPPVADPEAPLLVLCHGYPSGALGAADTGRSYPALADRIANEGWRVVTFTFRGCGGSSGDFSLGGWLDDLLHVIDQAPTFGVNRGVWLAGFGTGGGLCIAAAARRPSVVGVAVLGAPADYSDWASHPRRLLQHARETGAITDPAFPPALDVWTRQLRDIKPVDDAATMAPRALLILHGYDDESVPSFDARVLADSHGSAELRIIAGAAHDLRHDPRAVAILLGWLDRQRHGFRSPAGAGPH